MKKIFAISGSTRQNSSNLSILRSISEMSREFFEIEIFEGLTHLPYFNPDQDKTSPGERVHELRKKIQEADAVIICTPEYVFSIPGSLKNLLEWCVSTTVFSDKVVGLITASASGTKGHEELILIMKTLGANYTEETAILLDGIRGKIDSGGCIVDVSTNQKIETLIQSIKHNLL